MRFLPTVTISLFAALAACGSDTDPSDLLSAVGGSSGSGGSGSGNGAGNNTSSGGGAKSGTAGNTSGTQVCAPGKQDACACPGGLSSVQVCREDGAGFGPCECGAGGNGAGGKGGSTGGKGGKAGAGPFDPDDADGDGWTVAAGDCDDQDAGANPGSFEVGGNQKDDDCNGSVDDAGVACDTGLSVAPTTAGDVARAIGICTLGVPPAGVGAAQRIPGVIAASFSDISGDFGQAPPKAGASTALQLGILPNFGAATPPREGAALFALSSGVARAKGQENAVANTCGGTKTFANDNKYPAGFPKKGDCGSTGEPNDGIAVDLKLRVPTNAKSFKVRFRFLTCEFPVYVCDVYNDVFAILMSPSPLKAGDAMADPTNASANIAFEVSPTGAKNVIGVNNTSFLTACKAGAKAQYQKCEDESTLAGTGFETHAGSAWLETQVPIPAFPAGADRVIDLRFAIWDSADQALDSTALVDGFEWQTAEIPEATTIVAP